jgi:hypothetical protein
MPRQAQSKVAEKKTRSNSRLDKLPKRSSGKATAAEDEQDVGDAQLALKEARQIGAIPWEKVKRELGI